MATTTTTLPPTTTTVPKTILSQPLGKGMAGDEVTRLQERLQALGFQPGPIDGQFGNLTQMAVWAYQKLVMGVAFNAVDGIVTPEMWLALQDPLPLQARRPDAGKHTEIYLPQQALVVFDGNTPLFITHIASGELAPPGDDFTKGADWCEEVTIDPGELGNETGTEPLKEGKCGNSWTPSGVYTFDRKVEGIRNSRLGGMLNPVYFNYGIAVHGSGTCRTGRRRTAASASPTRSRRRSSGSSTGASRCTCSTGSRSPRSTARRRGSSTGATRTTRPRRTTTTTLPPAPTTTAPAPPPPVVTTPPVTTTTSTVAPLLPPTTPPAG